MVAGETGLTGPHVPSPVVVKELRPSGDSVTVQPQPTVAETARAINLNRDSVTFNVSQYKDFETFSNHFHEGPVAGGWGPWGSWSSCSKSCGGGTESKERLCDSPAPAHGGADCQGEQSEHRQCNTDQCLPGITLEVVLKIFYSHSP